MVISVLKIVFGFPAPIILALLLNEVRSGPVQDGSSRPITYLPHFLSWVVMAGIVVDLLSPPTGLVN